MFFLIGILVKSSAIIGVIRKYMEVLENFFSRIPYISVLVKNIPLQLLCHLHASHTYHKVIYILPIKIHVFHQKTKSEFPVGIHMYTVCPL